MDLTILTHAIWKTIIECTLFPKCILTIVAKKNSKVFIWETIQKPALNGVHIWILYDSGYRENVMCWQIRKVCNSFLSQKLYSNIFKNKQTSHIETKVKRLPEKEKMNLVSVNRGLSTFQEHHAVHLGQREKSLAMMANDPGCVNHHVDCGF